MTPFRRRRFLHHVVRTLAICGLLVAGYYLAPVEPGAHGPRMVLRAVAAVSAVIIVALLIGRLVTHLVRDVPAGGASALVVSLFSGLILFAFIDYLVALSATGHFHGLHTKTDALYFAVTTLATVGYGDIYAASQLARVVVIVQQLFNLGVLATGASVLVGQLTARARPDPGAGPGRGPPVDQ